MGMASPTAFPRVGVQDTLEFGPTAVATVAFQAGSLVIGELPLLVAADDSDGAVQRLQAAGFDWGLCARVVAFCRASKETQHKMLSLYSPEPGTLLPSIAMCQGLPEIAAHVAKDRDLASKLGCSPAEAEAKALRVMLIWGINSWTYNGHSALFELGSKPAHTCGSPNLGFRGRNSQLLAPGLQSKGCFVALRDIAAGELLCVSYLGGKASMQSTPARRHYLMQNYGFLCKCPRCSRGMDTCGGLPCPVCSDGTRDDDSMVMEERKLKGTIYCDLDKLCAGDLAPWGCGSCGASFHDNEAQLIGPSAQPYIKQHGSVEIALSNLILAWDKMLDCSIDGVIDVTRKLMSVLDMVGPSHWATIRMYGLRAEVHATLCAEYARGEDATVRGGLAEAVEDLQWHLEQLEEDYQRMWGWFGERFPDSAALDGHYVRAAEQLLGTAEAHLVSEGAVLEVQAGLARLARKLLLQVEPHVNARRNWSMQHVFQSNWDADMQRCERVLSRPILTLQEAFKLKKSANPTPLAGMAEITAQFEGGGISLGQLVGGSLRHGGAAQGAGACSNGGGGLVEGSKEWLREWCPAASGGASGQGKKSKNRKGKGR